MAEASDGDSWAVARLLASTAKTKTTDEFDGVLIWFTIMFSAVVFCVFACACIKAFRTRHSVAEEYEKASRPRDPRSGKFLQRDDDTPRDTADLGLLRAAAETPSIKPSIPQTIDEEFPPAKKKSMKEFRFELGTDFKEKPALPGDVEAPGSPGSPKAWKNQTGDVEEPSSPKTPTTLAAHQKRRREAREQEQKEAEDKRIAEAASLSKQGANDGQPEKALAVVKDVDKKTPISTAMPKQGVSVAEALGIPKGELPQNLEDPESPKRKSTTAVITPSVSPVSAKRQSKSEQNPNVPLQTWLAAAEDAQRSEFRQFTPDKQAGSDLDQATNEAALQASREEEARREEVHQRQALALVAQAEALQGTQSPMEQEEQLLRDALARSEMVQHASDEDLEAVLKRSEEENRRCDSNEDLDEALRRSMAESTYPYAQHGAGDVDTDLQEAIKRSVEEADVMAALNEQPGSSSSAAP